MAKEKELLRDTMKIVKEGKENMRRYGHPESLLDREICAIQQAHYDRVNEDARKTREEIRKRIKEETNG